MSDSIAIAPVKSSNISGIGYQPETKTLIVNFKNGNRYKYSGVEPEQHAALMDSDSIGRFFHTKIRGQYGTENITSKKEEGRI